MAHQLSVSNAHRVCVCVLCVCYVGERKMGRGCICEKLFWYQIIILLKWASAKLFLRVMYI